MAFDEANMNLLMQYLSAAGQDTGAGRPIGANVNAVTQQQVAARSYANLLKSLLSSGGKMTMDARNVNIKAPTGAFITDPVTGQKLESQNPTMSEPYTGEVLTGTPAAPTASRKPDNNVSGGLSSSFLQNLLLGDNVSGNPSSSPLENISGAALAGLTPQDISQALRLKMVRDELRNKRVSDVLDNLYRIQQIRNIEQKLNAPEKVDMTNNMKEYQLALSQGYKGSFEDWVKSPEGLIKQYEYAVKQGYDKDFTTWKRENASAGAARISIGEKVETAEAMEGVKNRNYFVDPKGGLVDDLRKYMSNSETVVDVLKTGVKYGSPEFEKARAKQRIGFIESKLIQAFGEGAIKNVRFANDAKTKMTWTVDTGSGEKEYTYDIRD